MKQATLIFTLVGAIPIGRFATAHGFSSSDFATVTLYDEYRNSQTKGWLRCRSTLGLAKHQRDGSSGFALFRFDTLLPPVKASGTRDCLA